MSCFKESSSFFLRKRIENDIIEKSKTTRLLGRTLPVSFNIEYKELYSTAVREIPKDKLVATASEKTAAALADVLGDGTLIRMHTDGGFEDSEYKMNTQLIFTKEIGRDAPFEVK